MYFVGHLKGKRLHKKTRAVTNRRKGRLTQKKSRHIVPPMIQQQLFEGIKVLDVG